MTLRIQIDVPQQDANGADVHTTNLQTAMESLSLDGFSHIIGQDTRFQAGTYVEQYVSLRYDIADTDLTTAQGNIAAFAAQFTFTHPITMRSWSISS